MVDTPEHTIQGAGPFLALAIDQPLIWNDLGGDEASTETALSYGSTAPSVTASTSTSPFSMVLVTPLRVRYVSIAETSCLSYGSISLVAQAHID